MTIEFEEFWSAWPRKVSRKPAETKWNRLTESQRRAALADVEKRNRLHAWSSNPRLIPHAATYLNQERWDDDWETELKASRSEDLPNSGPVVPKVKEPEYQCSKWEALANRLLLHYTRVACGLSGKEEARSLEVNGVHFPVFTPTDALEVKRRCVREYAAAMDEDIASGVEQSEAVYTFASLFLDQLDAAYGLNLKSRVVR